MVQTELNTHFDVYAEDEEKTLEGVRNMETKELKKVDVRKYVGLKVKVEKAQIMNTKFGFCLKLESGEIGEDKIKASRLLNFGSEKDEQGVISYFVIKDSKLDNFLKVRGLDSSVIDDEIYEGLRVPKLEGLECITQINEKTNFLDLI